jgi:hypothetical protein
MKILVVHESLYGNTKTIGEAIAEGLAETEEVTVGSVDQISPEQASDAALIVVGGPTHIHGMVSARSRDAARKDAKHGPVLPEKELLRDWLDRLPPGECPAAGFDTRIDKPAWLTGSAAKKIARRMADAGHPIVASESFLVEDTDGPLAAGERERALAWGRGLAAFARQTTTV